MMAQSKGEISKINTYNIQNRQQELLLSEGPSLNSLRMYGHQSPFSKFIPKTANTLNINSINSFAGNIRLIADLDSNVRAFYYLLLTICFQKAQQLSLNHKTLSKSQFVLTKLKHLVFCQGTNLQMMGSQLTDPSNRRILNNNRWMKKILAELFRMLAIVQGQDIGTTVGKYPVVDKIMIVFLRYLVYLKHPTSENSRICCKLQTEVIIQTLKYFFQLKIQLNPFQVIFQDQFTLREQSEFIYIKRQTGHTKYQKNKKTQQSDNTLSSSQMLDRPKNNDFHQDDHPIVPPLLIGKSNNTILNSVDSNNVITLKDIRQCSSKRESATGDQSPRKMSGQTKNNQLNLRYREAISQVDESSQSSMSLVLEKIQFGKNTNRADKKCLSSRFSKARNQLSQNNSLQNSSSNDRNTGPHSHKRTSIFAIHSVAEQEEEEPAATQKINQVKNNIYDGMTSDAVLKIMSPSVAKVVDQKKKQSVKYFIEKFNNPNTNIKINSHDNKSVNSLNTSLQLHQKAHSIDQSLQNPPKLTKNSPLKIPNGNSQKPVSRQKLPSVIFHYSNKLNQGKALSQQKLPSRAPVQTQRYQVDTTLSQNIANRHIVYQSSVGSTSYFYHQ